MLNFKASYFLLFVLLITFSCKKTLNDTPKVTKVDVKKETLALKAAIKKLKYVDYILSPQSQKATEDWSKYQELLSEIGNLKNGISVFFTNDIELLQTFSSDLKTAIPENLNVPEVTTRITALENCMYNFHAEANIKRDSNEKLINSIRELLVAESNLKLQINKKLELDNQNIERPN